MSHPLAAVGEPEVSLASWSLEPAVIVPVLTAGALYLAGWAVLSRRIPERFGPGRAVAFTAGLASLVVALASPVEALSHLSLSAHMVQHLILMVVAPPLLWLGAPVAPMLLGLPAPLRRRVARAIAWRPLRRMTSVLGDPRVSWCAFVAAFWLWHLPGPYDAALRSDLWHHVEHASFFTAALIFWRPVILPWPSRPSWPRWAMIPYLVLADVQNGVLAAILTFSDRLIYSPYGEVPRPWSLSPIEDQSVAGVIMWVPGSLAFLLPVIWLVTVAIASPHPALRPPPGGRERPELSADRRP